MPEPIGPEFHPSKAKIYNSEEGKEIIPQTGPNRREVRLSNPEKIHHVLESVDNARSRVEALKEKYKNDPYFQDRYNYYLEYGTSLYEQLGVLPVSQIDDRGEPIQDEEKSEDPNIHKIREIIDIEAVNKAELEVQGGTDFLTGLYNRNGLENQLTEVLGHAQRSGEGASAVFLDVDHFKLINDSKGHKAGDEVLIKLGALIRKNLRDGDIAGRFGGEEILILLPGQTQQEAVLYAERLRKIIENNIGITVSAGVTEVPRIPYVQGDHTMNEKIKEEKKNDLVFCSDEGIYAAKYLKTETISDRNKTMIYVGKDSLERNIFMDAKNNFYSETQTPVENDKPKREYEPLVFSVDSSGNKIVTDNKIGISFILTPTTINNKGEEIRWAFNASNSVL